jgi:O-antigen ligase
MARRTDAVPTERRPLEASALLLTWVIVLMAVPANLVVAPLGAAGTPAQILGLAAAAWWLAAQLDRSRTTLRPAQPVRTATGIFVLAMMAAYVAGVTRPIEAPELSSADRGLLLVVSWWGLAVLAGDGFPSRARLDGVLHWLVWAAGAAGVLGLVQYVTGQAIVDQISFPGLSANTTLTSVYGRNGFVRAAGTSTHPIEFGVLLVMVLPLALHYALSGTGRSRFARWWPVVTIGAAIPITMSRSAVLGLIVVLAILLPSWPARRRWWTGAVVVAGLLAVYVSVPGWLGTMARLFTGISEDDSAQSRTDSYGLAFSFIGQNPVFGRGLATFLPSYRILDNQYLGLLVETGVVGTVAFLGLVATALGLAWKMSRLLPEPADRGLARALMAAIGAAALAFATFDAFGFPQVAGVLFFSIGCVTALRRFSSAGGPGVAGDSVVLTGNVDLGPVRPAAGTRASAPRRVAPPAVEAPAPDEQAPTPDGDDAPERAPLEVPAGAPASTGAAPQPATVRRTSAWPTRTTGPEGP